MPNQIELKCCDKTVCSEKCREIRFRKILSIDPNLINPTIWSSIDSDFKLQKNYPVIYKSKSQIYNNLKDIESNKDHNNTTNNNDNNNNYLYYFTTFGIFYVILRLI
jgi:hypothetical protein